MYDKSTTRRKSPEVLELERLVNADLIKRYRNEDPRFTSGKQFSDHTDNGLISCIVSYIFLMGGRAERTKEFNGVAASFRGYDLLIQVAAGQPGKPVFNETRETIALTVHTFSQAKKIIDEL
jgi:hypothetical protein